MAYLGQATSTNARYLASKTGLDPLVALAWLRNEGQSTPNPTNPLNIRYFGIGSEGGQIGRNSAGFGVYRSTQAGLDAVALKVNNTAKWAGIRAAIKTGDPLKQAAAIENSPWAAGHYGGAGDKTGGVVRSYAQLAKTGLPLHDPTGAGNDTGPSSSDPKTGEPLGAWYKNGIPTVVFPVGHILTQADVDDAVRKMQAAGWLDGAFGFGDSLVRAALIPGRAWTPDYLRSIQGAVTGQHFDTPSGALPDIPGAIGDFGNVLGKIFTGIVGLIIIGIGVWLYAKGQKSTVVVEGGNPSGAATGS